MSDEKAKQEALNYSTGIRTADRLGGLLVSLPKWIACAIVAWQIRLSIDVLVGPRALPSLLTRFWRQASVWEVVCWAVGLLGLLLGLHSRHLLHRQVLKDFARMDPLGGRFKQRPSGSGKGSGA